MLMNLFSRWRLEKRETVSRTMVFVVPLVSSITGMAFAGFFIALSGKNPITVYTLMLEGAFGSYYGLSETVVKAIPLILASLAVGLAFRMQLWNIGAEGQLYMGAFGATWVALNFPPDFGHGVAACYGDSRFCLRRYLGSAACHTASLF